MIGVGFVLNLLLDLSDSGAVSQAGTALFFLAVPAGLLMLVASVVVRLVAGRRRRRAKRQGRNGRR